MDKVYDSPDSDTEDYLYLITSGNGKNDCEMKTGGETSERGKRSEKKRRSHKQKIGDGSKRQYTRDKESQALNAANAAARKRREEKRIYQQMSPMKNQKPGHQVTGTRRMLSIPIEDRLRELLPFCSIDQIRKCAIGSI